MKKFFLSAALLCGALLSAAPFHGNAWREKEKPFCGDERSKRSIRIGTRPVAVFTPGKQELEIVLAPDAPKATRYAAEELQKFLGQRLNTRIPLVSKPSLKRFPLFVGFSEYSKKAGLPSTLCRDGFIIRTVGKQLFIAGVDDPKVDFRRADKYSGIWETLHEHGSIFGVYDFLERFAGVRFYMPNEIGIYVPKAVPLTLPEIDIFDRPDWEARNVSLYTGVWEDEKSPKKDHFSSSTTIQKNRFSRMIRLQSKFVPNCHGLSGMSLVDRYAKSNPEFFALRSDGRRYCDKSMQHTGQLCYNSGVWQVILEDMMNILKNEPSEKRNVKWWGPTQHKPGHIMGLMPQDGYTPCRCEKCKAVCKNEQTINEFMWRKTVEAALIAKKVPDTWVTQMAYHLLRPVPPESIKLPDNLLVMVAVTGPFSRGEARKQEIELVKAWNKRLNGSKVWLWNYIDKSPTLPGIPSLLHRHISQYYQQFKGDIYGAYMESSVDYMLFNTLNYYIFGKICWDNNADADALLKEFHTLMFGAAAPVTGKIFDELEEMWASIISRVVDTPLGPMPSLPSQVELWNKYYNEKFLKHLSGEFDKAEKLAAKDPDALKRVRYYRAGLLGILQKSRDDYQKKNNAIGAFITTIPARLHLQPWRTIPADNLKTTVDVRLEPDFFVADFNCEEPLMAETVAPKREHDEDDIWKDNNVELFLDPTGLGKEFFQLQVNSAGSLGDNHSYTVGSAVKQDRKWSSNAQIKVSRTAKGWRALIRIPRTSFGVPFNTDGFKANFTRSRTLKKSLQYYTWSPFIQRKFPEKEHFGTLTEKKGTNLLMHSDFEGYDDHRRCLGRWVKPHPMPEGLQIGVDTNCFLYGDRSLKIVNTNPKNMWGVITQSVTKVLKPGKRYRINYFIKLQDIVPSKPGGGAYLQIWNNKNYWLPTPKLQGTLPWTYQSFEITADPAYKGESYLKCATMNCTGTVWFDHVTVEEIQ